MNETIAGLSLYCLQPLQHHPLSEWYYLGVTTPSDAGPNKDKEVPKLSFWSEFVARNRNHFQSWISDQQEFLLQISSVVIAYFAFKLLRLIGVPDWVVTILDTLDHIAIIFVLAAFLFGVVRRAYANQKK